MGRLHFLHVPPSLHFCIHGCAYIRGLVHVRGAVGLVNLSSVGVRVGSDVTSPVCTLKSVFVHLN